MCLSQPGLGLLYTSFKKSVVCFTLFEFLSVCLSLLTAREESQSDLQDRASAQGHKTEEDNVQQGERL